MPKSRPPHRYAASDITRLLCAGARLDPAFADKVIDLLLHNRQRFAAPAYGYDAVPVLGHALHARTMRRMRTAALVFGVVVILVLMIFTPLDLIGGVLLIIWVAWTTIFVERLAQLQAVVKQLRRPGIGSGGFTGDYPLSEELTGQVTAEIRMEQDVSDLVYYGGYLPFVGAGVRVRDWKFSVLLDDIHLINPLTGKDAGNGTEAEKFSVEELTTYVQERLAQLLRPDSDGLEELVVSRCWYGKAVGTARPRPGQTAQELREHGNAPGGYGTVREYLSARVGSWDQELVTSVFVNFDVKGRMLYTELNGYVLPPIDPKFRLVDQMPTTVSGDIVGRLAWHAIKSILGDLIGLPAAVISGIYQLARPNRSGVVHDAEDLTRYAEGVTDYGARASVRELAAISRYQHFFQEVDATKYITIIERRLFEVVLDFLDLKNVDTREFRDRQAALLNYGQIHTGAGDMVNNGAQAFGPQASATQLAPSKTH
jgi:hypothetical protein